MTLLGAGFWRLERGKSINPTTWLASCAASDTADGLATLTCTSGSHHIIHNGSATIPAALYIAAKLSLKVLSARARWLVVKIVRKKGSNLLGSTPVDEMMCMSNTKAPLFIVQPTPAKPYMLCQL